MFNAFQIALAQIKPGLDGIDQIQQICALVEENSPLLPKYLVNRWREILNEAIVEYPLTGKKLENF